MRLNILCICSRIFCLCLIVLPIFPSIAFADHNDLHSNTQAIESLNEFLTGGDLQTIIMLFVVMNGFSIGARS